MSKFKNFTGQAVFYKDYDNIIIEKIVYIWKGKYGKYGI